MTEPPVTAKDHEQQLIDFLIESGEAVEYGEPWTDKTTHEWWVDSAGERHCRLVQTYHGGGSRGDDDQDEYARRLIDTHRAFRVDVSSSHEFTESELEHLRSVGGPTMTHVIATDGQRSRVVRIRRYIPPPEGL